MASADSYGVAGGADDFGKEVAAKAHRAFRRDKFRVVGVNRRRDDDEVGVLDMRWGVSDLDADAEGL